MIANCRCESGCPSCIGADTIGETAKSDALKIIQAFLFPHKKFV
jgi:DEAD/DEAH box helicase domain-containing protein